MNAPLLLGLDVGTTAAKAVLVDGGDGALLAQAAQEYPTLFPHPGWAEQDPETWWQACAAIIGRVLHAPGAGPDAAQRVAAICISSQAPTLVLVDAAGLAIGNAMLWMDRRAQPECAWLHAEVGEESIARINGGRIDAYFLAPKILWMQRNRPEQMAQAAHLLATNGYIALRLTGAISFDASHGPLTLCWDGEQGNWSDALLAQMGIDARLLPPPASCGAVVGEVTRAAAEITGLRTGTPVLAGMVDGTAAALEAGVIEPGDAVEMTGHSSVLLICSNAPYRASALYPLGHALPGRHLVVGALVTSGGALRWFRDNLAQATREAALAQGVDPFDLLTRAAATSPAGAHNLLFLPYLYGERSPIWDPLARGVFCGLSLASTEGDMVRAILEGAAFGLRHNVESAAAAGFDARRLACVGGAARSPLWNQIKADVLQREVTVPRAATGAPMGDAILAAVGAGLYPNVAAAVAALVKPGVSVRPNAALAPTYDALYAIYRELYPALRASFAALAAVPSLAED
jgi:xylulokinase